jgi:hypothetical protein
MLKHYYQTDAASIERDVADSTQVFDRLSVALRDLGVVVRAYNGTLHLVRVGPGMEMNALGEEVRRRLDLFNASPLFRAWMQVYKINRLHISKE